MTTDMQALIGAMDEATALRSLETLAFRLRGALPPDELDTVRDAAEARELLGCAVAAAGEPEHAPRVPLGTDETPAKQLLLLAVSDPVIATVAAPIIESPPADRQMSGRPLMQDALVLSAAVNFLLTRIRVRARREDTNVTFDFDFDKQAATPEIPEFLATLQRIAPGG